MQITKSKLKKIIKEELQNILKEHPMPWSHRHRDDPLEATLWPIGGDLVYPALENLPASMYGGGPGPEGHVPYGHYGTDPALEWPTQWADPVPLIPGLTPEETAAYYGINPITGDPISETPDVGKESWHELGSMRRRDDGLPFSNELLHIDPSTGMPINPEMIDRRHRE